MHDLLKYSTAVCAISLVAALSAMGWAAEPKQIASAGATRIEAEAILREAGASDAMVALWEQDTRGESPEDIREFVEDLRNDSPDKRREIVENMRRNYQYVQGPDSQSQSGVPHGTTFEFSFDHSNIFPGTTRTITVYVPAQYTAEKPACVYVGLDSLAFEAPTVFDNLIAKGQMPVTIGIGIEPGNVPAGQTAQTPRFNRSVEFDAPSDQLARFLLEEVIPEVERHSTPAGLPIRLSQDPNDRAVGGASTGGIGSFTLAWEHPDAFRRVFSAIGTYVGMRGGDRYPVLVRKTEPKPIRIFMQDGSHDELTDWLGEVGDWWLGNQTMLSALQFAGYSVEHVWGEGSHDTKHATAVFPDAMRFLWADWPQPVTARVSQNNMLSATLLPGEAWVGVTKPEKSVETFLSASEQHKALAPGTAGDEYLTEPTTGKLWLQRSTGKKTVVDTGLQHPTGVAVSPDGLWLAVAESRTHWGYSYQIQPDGALQNKQRFYWFHVPDYADDSGAEGLAVDRDGRLYAATRLGVQVFDHNGRSRAILPLPGGEARAIAFDPRHLDVLYVRCADGHIYRRKFKVPGVLPGGAALQVPNWGPG